MDNKYIVWSQIISNLLILITLCFYIYDSNKRTNEFNKAQELVEKQSIRNYTLDITNQIYGIEFTKIFSRFSYRILNKKYSSIGYMNESDLSDFYYIYDSFLYIARLKENNKIDSILIKDLLRDKINTFSCDSAIKYIQNRDSTCNTLKEKELFNKLLTFINTKS